jgi:biotin carboxyl carrier protein
MDQKKFFIPETFSDENNNIIDNPKVNISSFNVKIGDIIKEGDLLCKLDLIMKDMSFICPIHAGDHDIGYISDILFEANETVKAG